MKKIYSMEKLNDVLADKAPIEIARMLLYGFAHESRDSEKKEEFQLYARGFYFDDYGKLVSTWATPNA